MNNFFYKQNKIKFHMNRKNFITKNINKVKELRLYIIKLKIYKIITFFLMKKFIFVKKNSNYIEKLISSSNGLQG